MKQKGFNGTSVKDIVDAAGVPKGSFYNYFESKEDFVIEALEYEFEQDFIARKAFLSDRSTPPLDRLNTFFIKEAKLATGDNYRVGCFLGNIGQELSDTNENVRNTVRKLLIKNTDLVAELLNEAREQGQLDQATKTCEMSEFIFNAWEGALLRMKASKSDTPLNAFLKTLPKITR